MLAAPDWSDFDGLSWGDGCGCVHKSMPSRIPINVSLFCLLAVLYIRGTGFIRWRTRDFCEDILSLTIAKRKNDGSAVNSLPT